MRCGSVFVVRKSKATAQLRLLILTADVRGLGLGGKLCDECIAFARSAGYKKLALWTNSGLQAARAIYLKRKFRLTKSEPYQALGMHWWARLGSCSFEGRLNGFSLAFVNFR